MNRSNMFQGIIAVAGVSLLIGCSGTRLVERDRYFTPVIRRVQPMTTTQPVPRRTEPMRSSTNEEVLLGALAESRREILEMRLELMIVRDSLRIIGMATHLQDRSTRSLVDKVAVLEQQLLEARTSPADRPDPQQSAPMAQAQPRGSTPSRPRPSTSQPATRPGTTLAADYSEGVSMFNRKRYDDAKTWFGRLLTMGIGEDLADNCEYWIGECDFARGRWTMAVESFERVAALRGSNKRPDAMLMLGRSFEFLRQSARARSTFEQLVREYPSSSAAATARWKLRTMQRSEDEQPAGSVLS